MKVGIIPPFVYTIPPRGYGGEIFVWDLACGLSDLGVEVHIFGVPGSEAPPNGYLHYVPEGNWFVAEQYPIRFSRSLVLSFDIVHDMSIHPDGKLLIYRQGKVKHYDIGSYVESEWLEGDMVHTSDYYGRLSLHKVRSVYKHALSGIMYRVKLRGGLEINVTANHSLFKAWRGHVISAKPMESRSFLIPGKLDFPINIDPKVDDDLLTLGGLWLADGCYDTNGVKFALGEDRDELLPLFQRAALDNKTHLAIFKSSPISVELATMDFKKKFQSLGFCGYSDTKRVPEWVFSLDKHSLGSFLRGYFSGDGWISEGKNIDIGFSTASEGLYEDIKELLLRFGITCSKVATAPKKTRIGNRTINSGRMIQSFLTEKCWDAFAENIGFLQSRKQDSLRSLREPNWSTLKRCGDLISQHVDIVEECDDRPEFVYDLEVDIPIHSKYGAQRFVCSKVLVHNTHSHFTHDFLFYRLGRHNVLSTPWGTMIMRPFCRENLVVWSRFHRKCALQQGFPESTRWVHGGVNTDFYCPGNGDKGDYFLWFARWHPSKRPDFAMQLAQQTGINLVMSGSSEESPDHQYYFNIYSKMAEGLENVKVVKMPLDSSHHQFKRELYRRARALILPYFQEAFGLVTCEALSCGTPVFGTDEGALPEIIRHGETGFLCRNDEEFVQAVRCNDSLSPEKCRSDSIERWDRRRVARDYLRIYEDISKGDRF